MGFPCQDISIGGAQLGLKGERSVLIYEGLRIAQECGCRFLFLENVDSIRSLPEVWRPVFHAIDRLGFDDIQWCSLAAFHVGSPQGRRRWFAVARRRGAARELLPRRVRQDGRIPGFLAQSGISFNGGRPPPERWLLPRDQWHSVKARLDMLGNAVVPAQVPKP